MADFKIVPRRPGDESLPARDGLRNNASQLP
jgi:hypothetical protein